MIASGYMSSTSFYIFLIITIILIFILCISNIVAYGNILANDNIEFNHTWAKILIAMNAILIAIAFVILIILIVKFYKGRTKVVAGAGGARATGGTVTVDDLYNLSARRGVNWDQVMNNAGGDCGNPFNRGCSGDLVCSDGGLSLPCPGNTANDNIINRGFNSARANNLL